MTIVLLVWCHPSERDVRFQSSIQFMFLPVLATTNCVAFSIIRMQHSWESISRWLLMHLTSKCPLLSSLEKWVSWGAWRIRQRLSICLTVSFVLSPKSLACLYTWEAGAITVSHLIYYLRCKFCRAPLKSLKITFFSMWCKLLFKWQQPNG